MHPRPQAAPAPVLRPRDQPGPHSIPLDVPQDGQQMFVALHREALEPSLTQMTVPTVRCATLQRIACVWASQRQKAVTWPSASGQTAKCQWLDKTQSDRMRIGCRWCASIMTRWNASKSASLPKRCLLATDRFSTWYTCPPGAFRAALGMGNEDTNGAVAAVNTSCVPVSVPRQSPSRMTRWTGYSRVCRPSAWRSSTIRKTGLRAVGRRGGAENERGRSWGV